MGPANRRVSAAGNQASTHGTRTSTYMATPVSAPASTKPPRIPGQVSARSMTARSRRRRPEVTRAVIRRRFSSPRSEEAEAVAPMAGSSSTPATSSSTSATGEAFSEPEPA